MICKIISYAEVHLMSDLSEISRVVMAAGGILLLGALGGGGYMIFHKEPVVPVNPDPGPGPGP